MARNVAITAIDGNTGFAIAELLLTNDTFSSKIDSVVGLSLSPKSPRAKEIEKLGAKLIPHKPGRERDVVKSLKESGADTLCLIPPAHPEKYDITAELIAAARKADVPNVLFLSSAGTARVSSARAFTQRTCCCMRRRRKRRVFCRCRSARTTSSRRSPWV
jgi:nucleoside-diphosphate-sugar epimerase